ncbi:MAG: hypothetical protein ACRD1T_12400, partial [Acidimicrobiia bacterium]
TERDLRRSDEMKKRRRTAAALAAVLVVISLTLTPGGTAWSVVLEDRGDPPMTGSGDPEGPSGSPQETTSDPAFEDVNQPNVGTSHLRSFFNGLSEDLARYLRLVMSLRALLP